MTTHEPTPPKPPTERICERCHENLGENGLCQWCRVYDDLDTLPKRPKRDQRKGA